MIRAFAASILITLTVLALGCPGIVVEVPPIDVEPPAVDIPPIEVPAPFDCNTFTQGGCSSGQFCHASGSCRSKFGNNHACLANRECQSNICSLGFCAECTKHSQCESNEWCDAFGDCRSKWNNGHTCLSKAECRSGRCCFGFCCG